MTSLLVFGAAGDLAGRYLFPAIAQLMQSGALPAGLRIRGGSREALDDSQFRDHVAERLTRHAPETSADTRADLLARTDYRQVDVTDPAAVRVALQGLPGPVSVYLALPPSLFAPAVRALAAADLPPDSRLVLEKPFGDDRASARELNELLSSVVDEDQVFRVDHFLAKQTVQNVLGLRFANRIFEPVWSARHVEAVDIVWDETLALEGRASYYDRAGALRDMVQNHLLQLLCLVAMEPPLSLTARDLRDRKVDVLRAVRAPSVQEVGRDTVRGRYTEGRVGERAVPSYVQEDGIDPDLGTETFAAVTLWIDNWRWTGVPFRLRSGKALSADRAEVVVRFREVPHLVFGQGHEPQPNVLRLALDPDSIDLEVNLNGAGDPFDLDVAHLSASLAAQEVSAYGRLLLDIVEGDPTLSIRGDEAEEAWRIIDAIIAAWEAGAAPLVEYPAGSAGPTAVASDTVLGATAAR